MEKGEYGYKPTDTGEIGSQSENGLETRKSLVKQRQEQLRLSDAVSYYDMWVSLLSESSGYVPDEMSETIKNVSFGLGFLLYDKWGEMGYKGTSKQFAFRRRLERYQKGGLGTEVILSYDQAE